MGERLRVGVVTPLGEELCRLVEGLEPRLEMVRDQELLPPERYPADHHGDPSFVRDAARQRRFEDIIAGADALYGIPGEDPGVLRRAVEANPGLRWVHTMAAGGGAQVKAAGLSAEQLARVTFTTSAGVHSGPLAEYALLGLLAGAKNVPRLQADAARHEWPHRWLMGQLREQTVLVVGLGGIGREVARILSAFGTRVIGTSRRGEPVDGVAELVHPSELAAVVGRVDGIVVTLPGTAATEKLVSAEVLAAVRPGTTLVNVGRGTVVDEDALVGALRDGRIGFAALDVFTVEPLDAASPLWDLPNVLISPHNATLTPAEGRRIAELFADNATRLLDGLPLRNVVNTVEFY
ncbi:D-2-hydroxyacid dehydrogenase [Pseudonocardia kunmingensis]|uniref:Phosphoglycerate dehydrogenase-like enzyme n=1 Tax=Pseudonocardia kunmingensis TaxID=630975 RepID=A0A543CYC8_9PSEU|nr:D-2-hydroxyacid dehydrogenase [Pseudonocardia kunmingensis]TQM02085.1 phosphoglycerate dehydrogenase-like enzyme [Pseudonocardia kunmingensis]